MLKEKNIHTSDQSHDARRASALRAHFLKGARFRRLVQDGGVIAITGGSSGIGLACAHECARAGARVILLGRNREKLDHAVGEVSQTANTRSGPRVMGISCDVTQPSDLHQAVSEIQEHFGRLDVALLSHGIMDVAPFRTLHPESIDDMMHINFFGTVHAIRAFLPLLQEGEGRRLVIVSSLAAKIAPPNFTAYSASKAALSLFLSSLRQELVDDAIGVMTVLPGPVKTPLIDGYIDGPYYPRPPGVPVISATRVARTIVSSLAYCPKELYVPARFRLLAWVASLWPGAVDLTYKRLRS